MVDYVVYYRVSTARQGRSGLGLEAQRRMVEGFLQSSDVVIEEFTDIESGKNDSRTGLNKAIALVKKTKAKLLIPKLDRFSRKVSFIAGIIDQGVELVVCEHPNVNTFFLHLLACFAEEERRQISERTKAALSVAKSRGVVLGRNAQVLAKQRRSEKLERAESLRIVFEQAYLETGSASGTAKWLNQNSIPSPNGKIWHVQPTINYLRVLKLI